MSCVVIRNAHRPERLRHWRLIPNSTLLAANRASSDGNQKLVMLLMLSAIVPTPHLHPLPLALLTLLTLPIVQIAPDYNSLCNLPLATFIIIFFKSRLASSPLRTGLNYDSNSLVFAASPELAPQTDRLPLGGLNLPFPTAS